MISKKQAKLVHSLEVGKYRRRERLFVAEGPKLVGELLTAKFSPKAIFATPDWQTESNKELNKQSSINIISNNELRSISLQRTPNQVLALFPLPEYTLPSDLGRTNIVLALDGIQDPGNMGTICRIADWFGIEDIICSHETVDIFNPKSIQATMGAIARIKIHYCDLENYLSTARNLGIPVYGTFLEGNNIYDTQLSTNGIVVMGNEGNGISASISNLISNRLLIPNYPAGRITTESLNVAVATAITVAEFRRRG